MFIYLHNGFPQSRSLVLFNSLRNGLVTLSPYLNCYRRIRLHIQVPGRVALLTAIGCRYHNRIARGLAGNRAAAQLARLATNRLYQRDINVSHTRAKTAARPLINALVHCPKVLPFTHR